MQVGTVDVPRSSEFLFGTAITFGIVSLVGIVAALPLPVVGLLLFVGWAFGFLAGAVGGAYTVRTAGVEAGGDGAKVGAVVGGLGNAAGAVVGTIAVVISGVLGFDETTVQPETGGAPMTVGQGDVVVVLLVFGAIGLVTGTITALLGGAVGGYAATRF